MTSHWPTFADELFWCACDNRTFDSEEAWQAHVVDSVLAPLATALNLLAMCPEPILTDALDLRTVGPALRNVRAAWREIHAPFQPSESSSGHAAPSR